MITTIFEIAALCTWCFAGTPLQGEAKEDAKARLDALVRQVAKANPKADFFKLRMAFTETANYSPYASDDKPYQAIVEALTEKDYTKAKELAEKRLETNFVDLRVRFLAFRACSELKKDEDAKFHKFVFDGLLKSILKSGDGSTPETAFVVISMDEENVVLGALGVRKKKQALLGEKGQKCDKIDGVDLKTGDHVVQYF